MTQRIHADLPGSRHNPHEQQSSILGSALLLYMVAMVLLLTLAPFRFRVPQRFFIYCNGTWRDMVHNILLFLPLGFLYRLSRRNRSGAFCSQEFGFGLLLSASIEATQLFIPGRYTQITDVVTNGLGAWVGAKSFDAVRNVMERERIRGIFSLELPLINLVYLLVPLLWLNGLACGPDLTRLWLHALLGTIGVIVLVSIYRHRFSPEGKLSGSQMIVFVLGWFLACAFPAFIVYPGRLTALTVALVIVTRQLLRLPLQPDRSNRRFELATLKIVFPLYLSYLLLLPLWPSAFTVQDFKLYLDFEYFSSDEQLVAVFRFSELIAALTLLGYLVAELRGRKKESLERTLGWVFAGSVFSLFCMGVVRTSRIPGLGDMYDLLPMFVASLYGGIIYCVRLRAIQRSSVAGEEAEHLS